MNGKRKSKMVRNRRDKKIGEERKYRRDGFTVRTFVTIVTCFI